MIIDLHCHSEQTASDNVKLDDLIARAKQTGLDAICLTEMNTYVDPERIETIAKAADFPIFIGFELATSKGHLLCYPPTPFSDPKWKVLNGYQRDGFYVIEDTIKWLKSQDVAIVAAHPYKRNIENPMGDMIFNIQGLDAIEVLDGALSKVHNDLAMEAAASLQLPCIGGSNTKQSLQSLGRFGTLFLHHIDTQERLASSISKGDAWAIELVSFKEFKRNENLESRENRDDKERRSAGNGRGGRDGRGGHNGRGGRGDRGGRPPRADRRKPRPGNRG